MARIQVYIDGLIADLPQTDLNLNLTYALKDRNGIAINSGSRSEYSFDLPATKQNDLIFSRFHNVSEQSLSKQDLLSALIIADGIPFFTGKCQMRSVTTQQDRFNWKGLSYKVSFYGNNVDWVADLKNKYLYQYTYNDITFDYGNIFTAYGNEYPAQENCAIVMKFKDWSTYGQVDEFRESTYALFIRAILKKIYEDIGYTIVSNFLDSDWFSQLILPLPFNMFSHPNGGILSSTEYSQNYFNISAYEIGIGYTGSTPLPVPFVCSNQTLQPIIGANPYSIITGQYTCPYQGLYLCKVKYNVTNITTSCYFDAFFGSGLIYSPAYGTNAMITNQDTYVVGEYVIPCNAGAVISLFFGITNSPGNTCDYEIAWEISGERIINQGATINPYYFINRQWKSIDLIKGLAHLFNLTFETNVALRSVTIEPSDSYVYNYETLTGIYPFLHVTPAQSYEQGFYNLSTDDLTRYVDLNVNGELFNVDDFERSLQFIYKEDSADPTIEALNYGQNVPFAGSKYNFPVSRLKDEINDIENPFFAPTLLFVDNEIQTAGDYSSLYVPFAWSNNYLENPISSEGNYDIEPRILIKEKNYKWLDYPASFFQLFDGTSVNSTRFPDAVMINFKKTYDQTSLSFSNVLVNGILVKGLLQRFYLSEIIRRLYGKQLEAYVFWNIVMLNTLSFRNAIQINGSNYILNEINSFSVINQRSTKTYLTYDAKGDGSEANYIENSNVSLNLNV